MQERLVVVYGASLDPAGHNSQEPVDVAGVLQLVSEPTLAVRWACVVQVCGDVAHGAYGPSWHTA